MAGERLELLLKEYRKRYKAASRRKDKTAILNEFCKLVKYHRKYAIRILGEEESCSKKSTVSRKRGVSYSRKSIEVIEYIWKKSDYPWSKRLKEMLPQWLPWVKKYITGITPEIEQEVLSISARQIDRRLATKKRALKRKIYGRTKPGTLLKHHIPVKTDCWDVTEPGFTEIDLVSHSGPHASGEFLHSMNITDIQTGWVETRVLMGKGQAGVTDALDDIQKLLPFPLKGLDSDNGSEFINYHLVDYCKKHDIQFTRGRPYMKNDNAHIEQKNWTHVRQVFGWDRYDTRELQKSMNDLYTNELSTMMNLFQASVKLVEKVRVGSKVTRRYDKAKTPLDRLINCYGNEALPLPVQRLSEMRANINPFELHDVIEQKLNGIDKLRRKKTTNNCSVI
ncbi:MAG: transposase family protein [Candidatus Hydrogenedentes bacterium]|nr:transposase family protein [Candidatus Hydrogenedentota bacterium]